MTNEIDLKLRYPESRLEDVTDAFMRGYQSCLETRPNPTWVKWLESLRHDEVKTLGDAVEQLMYEAIEFGGDMGPNGNTYNGIDEGDVLTAGYINEWIGRFENTLEPRTCRPVISDNLTESEGTGDAWADCSECGHLLFVLTDPNSQVPNFCPNCGKRVVE